MFDPDETIPYVLSSQDDVYRVGWTGEEVEILSGSEEEEVIEDRELWTHVVHADREPAPYAHSETDQEQNVEELEEVNSKSNGETQAQVKSWLMSAECLTL